MSFSAASRPPRPGSGPSKKKGPPSLLCGPAKPAPFAPFFSARYL